MNFDNLGEKCDDFTQSAWSSNLVKCEGDDELLVTVRLYYRTIILDQGQVSTVAGWGGEYCTAWVNLITKAVPDP